MWIIRFIIISQKSKEDCNIVRGDLLFKIKQNDVDIFFTENSIITAILKWIPIWINHSRSYGNTYTSLWSEIALAVSSLWFWCPLITPLNCWLLLLRSLDVMPVRKTTAFILISGPSYLETSGSSIWISNTCNWKHSELYSILSRCWVLWIKT